jgi:hypothetical protein
VNDRPQIVFTPASVDSGDGGVLAQAMRDEIAVLYDGLDLDGDSMPPARRRARYGMPISELSPTMNR